LKDTKTFKSNRNIPMHEDAKTVLSAIKPKEGDISDIYVYGTETGGLWLPRNFQRDYKKFFSSAIKAKCKVKYRSAHICRHTFASELRRAGVDPKTISELLGHTRVNLSLNVYTHTDEASKIEAISKL
jgi:integrase